MEYHFGILENILWVSLWGLEALMQDRTVLDPFKDFSNDTDDDDDDDGGDDRCWIKRSLLWEITGSLATVGNDLRVENQLLYSKPKIINKTNRLQPCPH